MNALLNKKNLIDEADILFDKKLLSRTTLISGDNKKTLGVVQPSIHTFGTAEAKTMEIIKGKCKVLLPKEKKWQALTAGQKIEIPANTTFQVEVIDTVNYVCHHG